MPELKTAPSPQKLADVWTRGFAAAVRSAAGHDERLTRSEAEKLPAAYADNVANWFDKTGQKSVAVDKLIASGHAYVEANAHRVAGRDGRVSLAEGKKLPSDLRREFFALRGKPLESAKPVGAATFAEVSAAGFALGAALDDVGFYEESGSQPELRRTRASSVADVKRAIERDVGIYDAVNVRTGRSGGDAARDALFDIRDFAEHALDGADRDKVLAALDGFAAVLGRFGDDIQALDVSKSAGRESWDSTVLVLGMKAGKPMLLDIG